MDQFIIDTGETLPGGVRDHRITLGVIMDAVRDSIMIIDNQGEIKFWNAACEELCGYTQKEAMGQNLLQLLFSDEQNALEQEKNFKDYLSAGPLDATKAVIQRKAKMKDGSLIDIEISLSKLKVKGTLYVVGIMRNISEGKKTQRELENTRQEYLELAERSPIGIVSCDHDGNIVYVNQTAVNILGSPNIEETKKVNLYTHPSLVEQGFSKRLEESIKNKKHIMYEMDYKSKWGKKAWLRIHIKPHPYGDSVGAQIIIDDISDRKNLENKLFIYSYTDALTGVYNRRYFIEKLEDAVKGANGDGSFSLIMIDLDHFKAINDRFGHNIGDFVLKTISSEFVKNLRRNDLLARWGGEEFIILLPKTNVKNAVEIAEKLREHLLSLDLAEVGRVSASFGVAGCCAGNTCDGIIQRADEMLYKAKLTGRNCVKY